jgi:hypothetical protein
MEFLEYWQTHLAVLACILLVLLSLATFHFPRIALRRHPKLNRSQVTARYPNLRWLRWGQTAWWVGTGLLMGLAVTYANKQPGETRGFFLSAAAFSLLPFSDGILALWTGLYRDMVGRCFVEKYFCVAQQEQRWIPRTQLITALIIAAVSLAGFWACDAHG